MEIKDASMNAGEISSKACCSAPTKNSKWFLNKNFIAILILLLILGISSVQPGLLSFHASLLMYLKMIWWAIVLGFIFGGLLDRFVPKEYISAVLAEQKKRSVFYAVMLGFLMSACSHGILALSLELYKKGASTPVVVAFLLASPWANLPITLMLISFFGLKAFYIILGALLVAFNTGILFQFLEKRRMIESNPNTLRVDEDFSVVKDIQKRLGRRRFSWTGLREDGRAILKGAMALADMTLWWVLIGIVLSSAVAAFIPTNLFHRYMGASFLGLLATLALATMMEVCSEGTAPLAFQIFKETGAFGNAFVFLMAGVVTDFTEIGLIWANVGRRTALWIPLIALPQVVLLGIIANHLF